MSENRKRRMVGVPERWSGRPEEHIRKVARGVNELFRGRSNNHYKVTLGKNTTQTLVQTPGVTSQVVPTLAPLDAATAAAINQIYAVSGNGLVTIYHDSNAQDRQIGLIVVG